MNNRNNRHTSERGRVFDSRNTRVLSVRCSDVDLALCSMMLESLGVYPSTISDVVKKVLLMVSLQAEQQTDEIPTVTEARSYLTERFGDVGTSRNRYAYNDAANAEHMLLRGGPEFRVNVRQAPAMPANLVPDIDETDSPLRGLSGEEQSQYLHYVTTNKLNISTFSPDDWKLAKKQEIKRVTEEAMLRYNITQAVDSCDEIVPAGCDPSLPIAVNDTPEQLERRVAERREREQLEKEEMKRVNEQLMKELKA